MPISVTVAIPVAATVLSTEFLIQILKLKATVVEMQIERDAAQSKEDALRAEARIRVIMHSHAELIIRH